MIKYPTDDESEEPLFRLKDHIFTLGAYVSITDELGELLAYKVTEITSLKPKAALGLGKSCLFHAEIDQVAHVVEEELPTRIVVMLALRLQLGDHEGA